MTTATLTATRLPGPGILAWSTGTVVAIGLVVGAAGWVVEQGPGLVGGLAGAGLVVAVLVSGTVVVDVVSRVMPAASLVVALLTYTLQVVLLALLLAGISGADELDRTLSPEFFAAAVLAGALAWTIAQVALAVRARVPLYDLPAETPIQRAEGDEA